MIKILVIDGQGGKLGRTLVENILARFPQAELTAVGTNYAATASMMKGGAVRAATGETPVLVACRSADIIVGPMGIAVADSLLGEISPAMANAWNTLTFSSVILCTLGLATSPNTEMV